MAAVSGVSAASRLLLVGLGNPGAAYAGQRHNIGFMAADAIAHHHRFPPFRARFHGEVAEARLGGRDVLILKPLTFMNESGRSVAACAWFFKIPLGDLIVFHDELDLAQGKVRLKQGGGAAGHNGLRSLDAHLGNAYWRVRLGIGHPGVKERVLGHVLGDFAKADRAWLEPLLAALAEHVPLLVAGERTAFLNKVTLALAAAKPAKPATATPTTADPGAAAVPTDPRD